MAFKNLIEVINIVQKEEYLISQVEQLIFLPGYKESS